VALDPRVFVFRVRLVDGRRASLQRRGRHHDPHLHQPRVFLAHPNSAGLGIGDPDGLGALWCVLGRVRFGNCGGLIHAMAVFSRALEDGEGLMRILISQSMKTQYYTATSLDGFIATEDDTLEWLFPLGDINDTDYSNFIAEVGAVAMGSATYEWMLRHALTVEAGSSAVWPYKQRTWVFTSRQLPLVAGADIQFVNGNVRHVHAAMREAAGQKNIWIVGGGDLAGQFYDAGLLDEMIISVGSVTLGQGKPLFPRRLPSPSLKLISVRQMGAGFAELWYQVPAKEQ
jgi:dihydrofolate reductase